MKRYISFLLTAALLLSLLPVIGVTAADAGTTDPDVVTFENWTVGTDLASVFASNTMMASVTDRGARGSARSAELKDTSATAAAILRYETEPSSFLNLEFDMLPVVGGVQLRISNGTRSVDNTAFWIGFVNKAVDGTYYTFLQYYDGASWIDVYQFSGTLANKWHAVQVLASVDGKAAVYVDGSFISEVERCAGGYGANVTTSLSSVVFECGTVAATGSNYCLDNLKLVPVLDSVAETFEDYAVGDVPHFPFTDANMATISDTKAKDGTKSVYMADTVSNQMSLLRGVTKKSTSLEVEFDMLPVTGAVALRISNGTRANANTAFWIKFANKAVDGTYYTFFQYYSGSAWVDAYQFNGTLANKWHAVRVEASAGGNARVFVDGSFIGQAPHCAGSYGTAAQMQIDSVIFECGDSTNASWKFYLDNIKLSPLGALDEDFEQSELSGAASAVAGYKSDLAAKIVADPVRDGEKALYLYDSSQQDAPYFEYGFTFHDKYTMEFEAYIEDAGNTLTFQLYDGRNGEDNSAYILQFNHAYGLRAFGGSYADESTQSWTVLNEQIRLQTGVWNKIRVEINTEEPSEAVVYLNDTLVGNTGIVYSKEDPVSGIHISAGDATQSCYIDNLKMTPAAYVQTVAPESVVATFEELTAGTDLSTVYASNTTMATVSAVKAKDSTHSAELSDTSATAAAILRMEMTQTDDLELDFDYNPAVGGLTFRLSNGTRSTANTAFWLGFANKKGTDDAYHTYLQYYSGTAWVDVYEFAGTLANKWSTVHVEATVQGSAAVYVDGVELGEVPRCGGTYGTNATTQLNSVIFECGSAAATGSKLYLDNVKLATPADYVTVEPEPVSEDFESVELTASVERGDPLHAVIKADPVHTDGKSLYLCDSTQTDSPYIDFTFKPYNRLTLEFDVYIPSAENTITFQLYDGTRTYSNTAFFLQFNSASGLRAYNGSYSVLNADAKLQANAWNRIRVEAINGTGSEAKIYLNDAYVGATGAYNQKDSVSGFYIFTGAKQSCYLDNIKANTSVEMAGDLLNLVSDLTVDELTIQAGKTLDLKGYTLNAGSLACFGSIIDSSEENTGKLIVNELALSDLAYMPVYDRANGYYRFFGYTLKNLGVRDHDNGTVTYGFAVEFANVEAYQLIAAGGSGVGVTLELSWNGNTKTFALDPVFVQEYAALQAKHPAAPAAIMLNVAGVHMLDAKTTLSVTPSAQAAGANKKGTALPYISEGGTSVGSSLLTVTLGNQFDIADNSEKTGLPTDNAIVQEDFSASGGVYGFTQIPNALYDPATNRVYVNYTRHRDVAVNYPYDSTKVYNVSTLLNAQAGAQLQSKYVDMKTENTMFFTAMTKLRDGRIFAQNYVAYYLTDTSATTYSWIVDASGNWTKVQGVLTLPKELTLSGAQPNTNWYRYGFSRSMVELDDGTLLGSMYGPYGTVMVQSKDYGLTWTYRSTIAKSALGLDQPYINTDGTDITWFEPAVTRCADGSLLCVMRTWRDKPLWQTRSYDDGLTWTEPTVMPGLEGKSIYPHLVLLSNGVLAMSTGVPDNTIYFSLDGCGYNWDYSVTTSSGDTTGNSAIAEVAYDAATGTVTLLAFGDEGFHNTSAAGVWGRVVKVTRKHVSDPQLTGAVIRTDKTKLGLNEMLQARLDAIFNADSGLITEGYTLQWKSLNPSVATVDQNGLVTTKAVGTAKICAVVSWGGKTVVSNELTVQVRDRNLPTGIQGTTTSRWIMKVGQMGSVTAIAENEFGQQFVSTITNQSYINGDPNVPKYLKSTIAWSYESLNPQVLRVDASTGAFRGLAAGVTDLKVTARVGTLTLTKTITMIVTGDTWVTQDFESASLPANCTATNLVSISTNKAYSGTRSVYINDNSADLAPSLKFTIPEGKGVVVEFMMYVESNTHAPAFGVGYPEADGSYGWASNTAYVGLLYNPLTGAQGYQAHNGTAWGTGDRSDKIPINQWNKIRLEITTDKPYKFYVNDTLIAELPLAAANEKLNTLFFSTGGSAYTGDAFYIDDVRYMVLN